MRNHQFEKRVVAIADTLGMRVRFTEFGAILTDTFGDKKYQRGLSVANFDQTEDDRGLEEEIRKDLKELCR